MLRKFSLAALALLFSAAIASAADSIALPLRMAGTNWTGSEAVSDNSPLRFEFTHANVTMINHDGATTGVWEQQGDLITMHFYDGRVVYTGTVRGQLCVYEPSIMQNADGFYVFRLGIRCRPGMITGTARNAAGATWNWSVTTRMLPIEVSGVYDGAPFGFLIPLENNDATGSGEAVLGRENPWPGNLTWNMRLMQP